MEYTAYQCDECGRTNLTKESVEEVKGTIKPLHFCTTTCKENYYQREYDEEQKQKNRPKVPKSE